MEPFAKKIKTVLLERKLQILEALTREDKEILETISLNDLVEVGDIAAKSSEQSLLDAIGAQNTCTLARIESALARIENGTYGICPKCGKMIVKDRLEILPEAPFCIECQEKLERFK